MPKSLIRKNQLSTDIADLVGQYGSGFFVTYDAANKFTASLTGENVVYTTGNQNISGLKSFSTRLTVGGTGVLLIGEATAGATVTNVVYTTGTQNVDGVKNFTGTLQYGGNTVATATNLASTGSTLQTNINNLSGSSVLTFGNQSITGTKTFTGIVNINSGTFSTRPTVNGTGVLLNGEGSTVTLPTNIFYTTGTQNVDGVKNFTGTLQYNGNVVATATNLASTGSTLQTNINNLSNTYATIANLASTGSTLQGNINGLSNTYATIANLASTGSTLQGNINGLSNTYATIANLGLTGSTLTTNLASTGSTLSTRITSLSGTSILTYGDQTASGNKTFLTNSVIYSGVNVNYNKDTSVKFSGTTNFTNTINSSGGMDFTSTPNLSTSPYVLDIYQEGTWNPIFSGSTHSGTYLYSGVTTGKYTRIGNIVNIFANIVLTGVTISGTGTLNVTNLPFTQTIGAQPLISNSWSNFSGTTPINHINVSVLTGNRIFFTKVTGSSAPITVTCTDLTTTSAIIFGGAYQI